MFDFRLPDLGEGIHEGEILKWLIKVGDAIQADAPLCEVETDKAAVVIPSPVSGRIVRLGGTPGQIINTGSTLVEIDDGTAAAVTPSATISPMAAMTPAETKVTTPSSRIVPAAPATRRLARELGIDINALKGSGPAGRVLADDVRHAKDGGVEPTETVPSPERPLSSIPFFELASLPDFSTQGPVEREPLRSIRRKVAKKMTTSMIVVPHVCHMEEIDVTDLEAFRRDINEKSSGTVKITLMAFVLKALTSALRQFPMFNASLDPDKEEIVYKKYYNVGFAADTGKGLVVPVVKAADTLNVGKLAMAIQDLGNRAREGKLDVSDFRASTFTVTNIGALGGTAMVPTINYPEVAILGMARVQQKPVVRHGAIVIRSMLPVTLAFDHRVADGADAARFVNELARRLSSPGTFLLES